MADSLIETMSGDFDPGQFTDRYREALQAVIDAKVEGREVTRIEPGGSGDGTVVDLMDALRASVAAAKKAAPTGDSVADKDVKPTRRAPARKAAARKATTRKSA